MLFVPLPLIATVFLALLGVRFIWSRDMTVRAHQLFAALIVLYAVQSLLTSLRWGYAMEGLSLPMALLAPVLPAAAYLAYRALSQQLTAKQLWPAAIILLNWGVLASAPLLADPLILLTYLGFGGALLRLCREGENLLSLPSVNDAREIFIAMILTGATLIASGLTDAYLIFDFITTGGANAPLILSLVQTLFVFAIGASAVFGKVAQTPQSDADPAMSQSDTKLQAKPQSKPQAAAGTRADENIVQRLELLFAQEQLHRNEDLSLRRLSRRLGLSDRQVSNAINRIKACSVSQFVNTYRIDAACELLRGTDDTILNISLAAGFATKSNFNREFTRVTGQSPSAWRAAQKPRAKA